ncbi:unnamed protein product [Camellia sinensis]
MCRELLRHRWRRRRRRWVVWWWRIGSRLASTESETAVNVRMFSSDLGQFGFELVADCMDWLEIEWIHSFLAAYDIITTGEIPQIPWACIWKHKIPQKLGNGVTAVPNGGTAVTVVPQFEHEGLNEPDKINGFSPTNSEDCFYSKGMLTKIKSDQWYKDGIDKPVENWLILNLRDKSKHSNGKIKLNADTGFRGLFKDEKKSWILGYSGKLDAATCLEAEIWAIYCGTTIIHEKGCKVLRLRQTVKSSKSDSKWCSPKLPIQSISGRYEILDSECDE